MSLPSDSTVNFQTCGHIGAGVEDDSTFSIVAVKVRSKLTNKIMQTYAFLDPGSSGTFCTETMVKRLNLRGGDTAQASQEYRMKVNLFGAASSPSCANYALRRTADDNAEHFPPEVVSTVKNNFYVDDCLRSMASEEEARKMIQDLTALCQKGGFTLSKWVSNSRAVLRSVNEGHRAKDMMELDLDTDQLPVERTLGLQWYVETDQFGFKASAQEHPQTRRGILSVVSSLYDPLGFLAPFSMMAKLLLQELCKRNLGWDKDIPHVLAKQWAGWLEDLHKVAKFKIDRCIKPNDFGNPVTVQLHHFSDASEVGYGAVSYLRLERDNKVHVAFMMGSTEADNNSSPGVNSCSPRC